MVYILLMFVGIVFLGIVAGLMQPRKRRRMGRTKQSKPKQPSNASWRTSLNCRVDAEILISSLDDLSGPEFERLLALYFLDQGCAVKEVGVGGNDGGVDLVITDKRGEKTAVQAKCYADHNLVPVQTVRELVAAKRNHDCILSLLVTTSDLTGPAKKEAEQFKIDYWHGALVEQKLKAWGKWQPKNRRQTKAVRRAYAEISEGRSQVASGTTVVCICGAAMVQRKGKEGKAFLGCSKFPACRHTKSV